MEPIHKLRVFLASPGDVNKERKQAREVVEEINRTIAAARGVLIETVGWETHAYPSYGRDAQSLVNEQIANMDKFDLFVGIMWKRFGRPTPRAESGTEEEF